MDRSVNAAGRTIEDILPLTPMQESMLFQYLKEPGSGQYFEQLALFLKGDVDREILIKAWNFVADMNESLRTVFRWDRLEQPVQVIMRDYSIPVRELDFSYGDNVGKREIILEAMEKDRTEGIDIGRAPFRVTLCRLPDREYAMIVSNHHILYDGWSNGIMINEFIETYNDIFEGREPKNTVIKYKLKDYIKWTRRQDKERQNSFWREYLNGFDTKTMLPADVRKQGELRKAEQLEITLPGALADRIYSFARENGLTSAVVFYTAWGILLQKYNNSNDVLFGAVVSGRAGSLKGIGSIVGLLINSLPLRVKSNSRDSIISVLHAIDEKLKEMEEFENSSLPDIRECSAFDGSGTLFDSLVAIENYPLDRQLRNDGGHLRITGFENHEKTNSSLVLSIMPFDDTRIKFIYDSEMFTFSTIEKLSKQYIKILDEITAKYSESLSSLELTTDEEKDLLLSRWNQCSTAFPKNKPLQVLFEEQAEAHAASVALKLGEREMSYGELNEKANRLAWNLREKGVGPNTVVGLMVDRSFEMIVCIIGILKAGGAYLPLDPEFPGDRTAGMIKDAGARLLICKREVLDKVFASMEGFKTECGIDTLLVDNMNEVTTGYPGSNPACANISCDCAYVMYTSGSSGVPKGVLTTHYNICRVVRDANYIELTPSDILLQLSNFAFDGSTFDIFGAVLNGAKLVLLKKETVLDFLRLPEIIRREKITVFFITTALFNTLADLDPDCLRGVRKVLFGGERVSLPHVRKAFDTLGPGRLVHVYGPTETTVFAAYYPVDRIDAALGTIPIGKPISNTELYVLDSEMKLLPPGCPGELYISGDGVARGYLNRPELSSERFIRHPFKSSGMVYKTGDLVRWLSDGNMEFLGRLDGQVKLRGFRVELGEIEARMLAHGSVKEAVVAVSDDNTGNKQLCAYIVPGGEVNATEIRSFLSETLPAYMIPSHIYFLNEMPLTPNGKTDMKALAACVDDGESGTAYEAPANETEEKLERIWRDVLGADRIGVHDNFYELGGHSLKATVLASRIHKVTGVEVPLAEILKNTTIRQLAEYISSSERKGFVPIRPAASQEYYPVSSAQKRMFVQQYSGEAHTAYNIPVAFELLGRLDPKRMADALKELVNRHEALRTSFHMVEGQIVQKIHDNAESQFEYCQIAEGPVEQADCFKAVKDLIGQADCFKAAKDPVERVVQERIKPFDLSLAPLFRVTLVKAAEDRHILLLDMHHIISDGISTSVLVEELSGIYGGEVLDKVTVHYKDFAVWQEEALSSERMQLQEKYWLKNLGEEPLPMNMPLDFKRPEKRSFKGSCIRFSIPGSLCAGLEKLASRRNETLNNLLVSIYFILLQKYTGQEDLTVGSLVAGRRHPDVERVVGMFNNFLPLRMNLDTSLSFEEFFKAAGSMMRAAYENQEYPYDMMVDKVVSRQDPSRNPLFDTMLIFHNQLEAIKDIRFGEAVLNHYPIDSNTSKLDFKLDIYKEPSLGGLNCVLEYSTMLFKRETVERMAEHFVSIASEVAANPGIRLDEIEMLSQEEKERILSGFNDTSAEYPKDRTIHRLFEEQAEKTPERTAVIFEDRRLTYGELNDRANRLARTLREKGVKRDSVVGILIERSLEMSIGVMAILKAGGAYLPISPAYPGERIRYMLEDSGACALLVREEKDGKTVAGDGSVVEDGKAVSVNGKATGVGSVVADGKAVSSDGRATADGKAVTVIDMNDEAAYALDGSNLETVNLPTDLAYVIYTSGSTGKPKGAMIEHRSLVNRLHWMQKMYPIGEGDVILQKTPYTFDVSVWELFWWSMTGASVCFLTPGGEKDPETIVEAVEKQGITTMHFVPSMLAAFLGYVEDKVDPARLRSLRQVFASGEALNPGQVAKFNRLLNKSNGTRLHNLYGPTEATVDVSYFNCSVQKEFETIPIGRPIDNIRLYIVNKAGRLQPVGVPGELCIAGDGLARGYLNRPELTREKFVENPFEPGGRMYRTGDLARWMSDGNIEYLGRMDNQVKIRGFRIELGEIEAELLKHGEVREAVAAAMEDREGGKYLCAYIVSEKELPVSELREHLSGSLPEYMIPSYFLRVESIPLTANGKVDRKALPEPDGEICTGREYAAPANEVEEKLVEIWKEVLGIEKIGVNDNFFELGGHSLKAASLALKIHKEFGTGITIGEIFEASTVRAMASLVEKCGEKTFEDIEKVDIKEYYPVSSSQKRLFIINRLEGSSTAYNLPSMSMVEGEIDLGRFTYALEQLVKRHESLRTSFRLIGEEPVQIIHDDAGIDIQYMESPEDALLGIAEGFIKPFDLSRAPLVRAALVKTDGGRHLLLFDMHHIIADGVSSVILVKEFAQLYSRGELPELKLQFKDYAAWQNSLMEGDEIKNQEAYWKERFKGTLPVLNLPADYARPSMQTSEGDRVTFGLDNSLTESLRKISAAQGATFYMTLLAVYNTLLHRYSGQEDIIVGSPTAGRQHADVENLIGMFVNTLALRSFPEGGKTFSEFLGEVKDNAIKAYENQDYQFEKLVDSLNLPRDISRNPMFDTMFVLQNMGIPQMEFGGLKFVPFTFRNRVSKFDLTFEVIENADDTTIHIEYSTRLFKRETVERMAEHFVSIASEVAANPGIRLDEIEMLSQEEKERILSEFNDTAAVYPKDTTIHRLFEEQTEKTPERTAVIFEDRRLTYGELNDRANRLARTLREKGVKRDSVVGILTERSLEMSIGVMAILKAGGAYLPISPAYPGERIRYMLEDSGACALLVREEKDGKTVAGDGSVVEDGKAVSVNGKATGDGRVVGDERAVGDGKATGNGSVVADRKAVAVIDMNDEAAYSLDGSNLKAVNLPTDLAYVIYTSGSTGKPKGAMIEHRSLVNRLHWMQKMYPIGEGDVILQKTPYTFDVSVWELFWWSMAGASVCFLTPGGEKDPETIVEAVEKHGITTMHFVPSMLAAFLGYVEDKVDPARLRSLRQVFASGEALNPGQVAKFNRLLNKSNGTRLHNLYGPTEATVDVSYFDCSVQEEFETIPIGRPIDNIRLYIVNKAGRLQPEGAPGELCIAGDGLARGYLNRPELTREKFVENPFEPGGRMYRTGDLARWMSDGNIEYLGRMDNQVKIRGFRIELGEIEAELLKHGEVKEAVAAAREDREGGKYLCAYIVSEKELSVSELREHLSGSLPEYMIPSYFVRLESIPLTANGKVDRKALPEPDGEICTGREYAAPANEVEEKLVEIWKEVLGIEKIGVNDRFFELGGYSILLIKMHAKLDQLYPGKVKITDLFAYPTIASIAQYIINAGAREKVELSLSAIPMPKEYFAPEGVSSKEVGLRLDISPSLEERISLLAGKRGIDSGDILLSVYAYLLSQVSGCGSVTIQTTASGRNVLYPLDIDLGNINSFSELFGQVAERRASADDSRAYGTKDLSLKDMAPDVLSIIPLFYKTDLLDSGFDVLELFQIAFEIGEETGRSSYILRFNGKKLSKAKMKEFAGLYMKLLELFLE